MVHGLRFAWAPHGALAGESKVNKGNCDEEIEWLHQLRCIFTYIISVNMYIYINIYTYILKWKDILYDCIDMDLDIDIESQMVR